MASAAVAWRAQRKWHLKSEKLKALIGSGGSMAAARQRWRASMAKSLWQAAMAA
jgi:hypothetical protein